MCSVVVTLALVCFAWHKTSHQPIHQESGLGSWRKVKSKVSYSGERGRVMLLILLVHRIEGNPDASPVCSITQLML